MPLLREKRRILLWTAVLLLLVAAGCYVLWNESAMGNAETDSPWFSLDTLEEGFSAGGYRFSSGNYCRWQPLTQAEEAGS